MSILIGTGYLITTYETVVTCPICENEFDAGPTSEKKDSPFFKMKCPRCKGKLQICIPIFGGNTTCSEIGYDKQVRVTPETVNGIPYPDKKTSLGYNSSEYTDTD